jgi:hypothetical protein
MSEEKKKVTTEMLQDLLVTLRSEKQERFVAMMDEMGDLIPAGLWPIGGGDGKTLRDES